MVSRDVKMTWLLALVFSVVSTPGAQADDSLGDAQPLQVVVSPQGESLRDPKINAVIHDSDAPVAPGSIRLFLNGIELMPLSITGTPDGAEAEFQITTLLEVGSVQTAQVVFSDNSVPPLTQANTWTFVVGPLARDTLFIEAEDFNYSDDGVTGGLHLNFADPECSLLGKDAVLGVDYNEVNDGNEQAVYRAPTGVEVGRFGADGFVRGDHTISCNYVLGWTDAGDWYNYTRHFNSPPRYFYIYARASSAGGARARLDLVQGAATTNQTLTPLGTFEIASTGSSNLFSYTLLQREGGERALVRLCGERTLRFTILEGNVDVNYFAIVPCCHLDPAPVAFVEPRAGSDYARAPLIQAMIATNEGGSAVPGSLKLYFDCIDVTTSSTISNVPTGTLISFQTPELSPVGTRHDVRVEWLYDEHCGLAPTPWSYDWSYTEGIYNPEKNLFIEAEDFDTGGGVAIPSFNGIPFNVKAQYNGLGAVKGVDFNDSGNPEADVYRRGEDPNIGMSVVTDAYQNGAGARPGFETIPDYRIGWNSIGDWYNYTRNWPSGWYRVYVRAAHADPLASINGELGFVHTNGAVRPLGRFQAPATGGWDNFIFVPLRDAYGYPTSILLRDVCTLRYTSLGSADINYLMFVPEYHVDWFGPTISIRRCDYGNGTQLTFHGGVLQSADAITGPWTEVTNAPNPFIIPIWSAKQRFWRVSEW